MESSVPSARSKALALGQCEAGAVTRAEERIERDVEDLRQQLAEHVRMLIRLCSAYDEGESAACKAMCGILYQLFYDGGRRWNSNKPLLAQLGLVDGFSFLSSGPPPEPGTGEASLTRLMELQRKDEQGQWKIAVGHVPALCEQLGDVLNWRLLPFEQWWSQIVIALITHGKAHPTFTRASLVKAMGDMDGGRHTDTGLSPDYHRLSRNGGLGMARWISRDKALLAEGIDRATIRQISHETLLSLRIIAPEAFGGRPYRFPAFPLIPDLKTGNEALGFDKPPPTMVADDWLRYYAFIDCHLPTGCNFGIIGRRPEPVTATCLRWMVCWPASSAPVG